MLAVCRPDAIGGQAACANMLLNHLDVEWTVVSFPLKGQYNSFMRFLVSIKILLECLWICLTKRINAVHLLTACARSALFEKLVIARVLKLTGVKIILNFQGAFDHFYGKFSERERKFVKSSLSKIDLIICLHDDMKNFLIENNIIKPEQIAVIANAVVIEPEPKKVKNENGVIHLLYLGWIVGSKGLDVLIRAVALLIKKGEFKKISLDIIGPEVEQGLINKLTLLSREEEVEYVVKFHPPVFGKNKNNAFARTDIFVFPTRMEGFPFVLLEAMLAGLPVVSTNISPINLVIQHNVSGMLFEKDNASDFAGQIHKLMNDGDKRKEMGKVARQHIVENYSVEKIIQQYTALYNEL